MQVLCQFVNDNFYRVCSREVANDPEVTGFEGFIWMDPMQAFKASGYSMAVKVFINDRLKEQGESVRITYTGLSDSRIYFHGSDEEFAEKFYKLQ